MRVVIAIVTVLFIVLGAWLLNQESSNNDTEVNQDQTTVDSTVWISDVTGTVDGERIVNADDEPGNWLAHGRTYDEQRFSPLDQITADNVGDLGLAWYFDTGTDRGLEASPIVVDGVMYTSGSWSVVFANDARGAEGLGRQCLLRCGQSGRFRVERSGLCWND